MRLLRRGRLRVMRWLCETLGLCPPRRGYRDPHAEAILRSLRAQAEIQRGDGGERGPR
jgi:hypothetical protein